MSLADKTEDLADRIFDVIGEQDGADIKKALVYNLMEEIMEDDDPLGALKDVADQIKKIFEGSMVQKKRAMH